MPTDLNRTTLVGRLTRDPELRHNGNGDAICAIRLAVNSRGKQGDEWVDKPNYLDVTVFGRQAETASTYLAKGRRIGVDGRFSWREWQAQDGTKRQSVEVIANDIFFLDSRGESGGRAETVDELASVGAMAGAETGEGDDSDIPF